MAEYLSFLIPRTANGCVEKPLQKNSKIGHLEAHVKAHNTKKSGIKRDKSASVRSHPLFRRTWGLIDGQLFKRLFLRGVLGGFDTVVRLFAMAVDFDWPKRVRADQEKILKALITKNKNTIIGREYSFEKIETYEDFRKTLPVFSYETISPYIALMIAGEKNILTSAQVVEYAKSSGTSTGRSKYIPTPASYMQGNHLKGNYDMISSYARAHPHTNIFSGKTISITGSYSRIPDSQYEAGDISALMMRATPWWTAGARSYSKELALHPSWPHKAKEIVEKTLDANVVLIGGTPVWMIEILEMAKEKSGVKTLRELWPNIEVFFHGAVPFAPYRKTVEALIGKESFEFHEVYNASEGFFAFEDEPKKHPGEMLLCTDHDIFYEFVPVEDCIPIGDAVPLSEVKPDVHYAILITTGGGLWRYMVGDVIVFCSTDPYRLKIVGRTTQYINAFGEEVVADNASNAIEEAAQKTGAVVQAFTAAPTFDAGSSQGAHEWAIEFRTEPKERERFALALDEALRLRNSDYDAKRTEDVILGKPIVRIVPAGTFRKFMEAQGKLGGQNKVPILCNERKTLEGVLSIAR